MEVIIRKATLADLEQLIKLSDIFSQQECQLHDPYIDLQYAVDPRGKKYLVDYMQDADKLELVAEQEGRIVGYLTSRLDEGIDYRLPVLNAVLDNIFIDQHHRGGGIGSKLMQGFLDWCKEKQVKLISVSPYAKNEKAINFYKKYGFEARDIVMEREL